MAATLGAAGVHTETELIPAYRVKVLDSTGAGDVFHGAYAAALLYEHPEPFRYAAAAAAVRCQAATCPPPNRLVPDGELMKRPTPLTPAKARCLNRLSDGQGRFGVLAVDQRPPLMQVAARATGKPMTEVDAEVSQLKGSWPRPCRTS